ncbi:hypothetical protein MJ561_15525 [Klebsiella pneumoniae]|nr:hypothetical protein MJ561_15525 [Klebsiella pneumoniae]
MAPVNPILLTQGGPSARASGGLLAPDLSGQALRCSGLKVACPWRASWRESLYHSAAIPGAARLGAIGSPSRSATRPPRCGVHHIASAAPPAGAGKIAAACCASSRRAASESAIRRRNEDQQRRIASRINQTFDTAAAGAGGHRRVPGSNPGWLTRYLRMLRAAGRAPANAYDARMYPSRSGIEPRE